MHLLILHGNKCRSLEGVDCPIRRCWRIWDPLVKKEGGMETWMSGTRVSWKRRKERRKP